MHEGNPMNSEAILARLLDGWLDGGPGDAEQADLLRHLDGDAGLCRRFAEQVALIGATRAAADANPRWLAVFDLIADESLCTAGGSLFEATTMDRILASRGAWWSGRSIAWGLAAAVALLLAGGFLLKSPKTPVARTVPQPADASAIAVVLGCSGESTFAPGSYLQPGTISQDGGWITFQTLMGVSVTLDAPFEAVLISHDRMGLNHGRARVRVPDGVQGFKLESPSFDVVDLGTEFAAMVNADGTGTCRVFEGGADVFLLDSIGEVKRSQRLAPSESVRISPAGQSIKVIQENDDDYPELKMPPRPRLRLDPSYAAEVMRMAPAGYWRFETASGGIVPNEVPDGHLMEAVGTATIIAEEGGNHAGELTRWDEVELFEIRQARELLEGDFTISLFAQFDWLQNYALVSAVRYDEHVQGHPFIMQSLAAFRRTAQPGTALNAVFRDPPAWDGGVDVHGNTPLRPLHWHHMVAIRSGGQVTLHLDGEVVARQSVGSMNLDCRHLTIGRLNASTTQTRVEARGIVGRIDELAIFTRALVEQEIHRLGARIGDPR